MAYEIDEILTAPPNILSAALGTIAQGNTER